MKKIIVIMGVSVIALFVLLYPISVYFQNSQENLKKETKWYVEQLNFDFSGKIDSITTINPDLGFIRFHLVEGNIDESKEDKLNDKVTHIGSIKFINFKDKGEMEILTHYPKLYVRGDSVSINTNKNSIIFYRTGQEIFKDEVASYLKIY